MSPPPSPSKAASPSSPESTTTPRPFPSMLPLEEKALPPPPLEQILDEMPSASKSPGQDHGRDSSDTFTSKTHRGSSVSRRQRTSSESASLGSQLQERLPTHQLQSTRSNPCPIASPRMVQDAGSLDLLPPVGKDVLSRRRRKDSRSSRTSSNASSHYTTSHELPDPSTFPIPPSPGLQQYSEASPASPAANSQRHFSSDVSSGNSNSARGSLWSSSRCSRNSSWDTQNSSPCSTSLRHQSLKEPDGNQTSSLEVGPPPNFDSSIPSLAAAVGLSGESAAVADEGDDDVGLGITSELECVRSSRIAVKAPPDSPQAQGRWAHHRNPSWAWRGVNPDGLVWDASDPVLAPRPRPSLPQSTSSASMPGSTTAETAVTIPDPCGPPAVSDQFRPMRGRAQSAASATKRQASIVSINSSSEETSGSRSVHSPIPFNPRTSSLKRSMRGEALRSTTPATLRTMHRGSSSGSALQTSSSHSHSSSIKSVEEVPEIEPTSSTDDSSAGLAAVQRRRLASSPNIRHQRSASEASSFASLEMSSLAFEFPHALGTASPEVGNAVKFVESGRGVVVEANGRCLDEFEHEIGCNTTHLVLSGCKSDDLLAFLDRAVKKTAHCLLVLDVSNTGLTSVPECIARCLQLEELNLSCNILVQPNLPSWIGEMSQLRVLALDETAMSSLPFAISRLSTLKALSVRRNRLTHLPSWLHLLTSLERLYVDGNPFKGPWLQVIASILPKQVQYVPKPPTNTFPHTSSPAGSHDPSPSVSPVSERGAPRRRPFLQRMRSDNDFRAADGAFDPNLSPKTGGQSALDGKGPGGTLLNGPSPAQIEEQMHRRGLVASETANEGSFGPGDSSKWGFLRKVARKSSQGKSLAQMAASPSSAGGSTAPSVVNSGSTSPVFTRPSPFTATSTPDPRTLPRLNTSALRMTRTSRSGSTVSALGAPFQQAAMPTVPQSQEATKVGSAVTTVPLSRAAKRMSFLPVQSPSVGGGTLDSQHRRPSATSAFAEEDAADEKRRLHALMCYLRDLDDLSPQTLRRRSRASFAASAPSAQHGGDGTSAFSGSIYAGTGTMSEHAEAEPSPIRRRPSGMLLSTSASAPQLGDIKDDSNRRRRIVEEIISSEESYLRGLLELVDIYVKPARKAVDGSSSQPVLLPAEHRTIFGNVEGLVQFHQGAFLPSLRLAAKGILSGNDGDEGARSEAEDAAWTANAAEAIAGVFTKHAAFFRMYSTYINGCDEAQTRITNLLAPTSSSQSTAATLLNPSGNSNNDAKDGAAGISTAQRKRFKAFMKRCRLHPRHSQLNVESYLLLPVQRIPRYELLLKDLARSTDPKHLKDSSAVSAALGQISSIAASVNESKRQSEQDRKLLAWQNRMRGPIANPLVQPHRRLIRDGTLVVRRVVNRMHAFDTSVDDLEDALLDGAYADTLSPSAAASPTAERGPLSLDGNCTTKTIDCLRQSSPSQPVTLLLCNDCCIVLRDALPSPAAGPHDAHAPHPVELYSMLQFQQSPSMSASRPSSPRCAVMGGTTLRMVGAHCVYYFSAQSPQEAAMWCKSINSAAEEQ